MKNIIFYGNDNYFWTYSTPNLAIPNKETLLSSKKRQLDAIRPTAENKPRGILDSLTSISNHMLIQAEQIQTESEEITRELPRIHLIRYDSNRLYEIQSLEHTNITPYSMLDYNVSAIIIEFGNNHFFFQIRNNDNCCLSDLNKKSTYLLAMVITILPRLNIFARGYV